MLLIVWRQFSTWLGWHWTSNFSLIALAAQVNDPGTNVLDGLFPVVASLASISSNKHCIWFDHLNCSPKLSLSSSFVLSIVTVTRTRRVVKIEHTNTKNDGPLKNFIIKMKVQIQTCFMQSIMKNQDIT